MSLNNSAPLPKVPHFGFWRRDSVRLQTALLMCGAMFIVGTLRSSLGMAMVCMLNQTALASQAHVPSHSVNSTCRLRGRVLAEYSTGTLEWSGAEQGWVFAAFFWGSFLSGLPSGVAADRWGPKRLVVLAIAVNSLGALLTPWAALEGGFLGLCVVRLVMGMGQGLLNPCGGALTARWHAPFEKATVSAIVTGGNQLAAIAVMPLASGLCGAQALGGWPSVFYLTGAAGLLFLLLWLPLIADSPEQSTRVSPEEKAFIAAQLSGHLRRRKDASVPWVSVLASPAVWAAALNNLSTITVAALLTTYLPTYFRDVLSLDVVSNGLLSALPFAAQWLAKVLTGPLGDWAKRRTAVSHDRLCKAFNSVAAFACPACLVALGLLDCRHKSLAVALLVGAQAARAGYTNGFQTSVVSLAPQFSGTVSAVCRVVGQTGGMGLPLLVGALVSAEDGRREQWERVFLAVGALAAFSGVVFVFFGTTKVQPWALPPSNKESTNGTVIEVDDGSRKVKEMHNI